MKINSIEEKCIDCRVYGGNGGATKRQINEKDGRRRVQDGRIQKWMEEINKKMRENRRKTKRRRVYIM